MAKFRIDQNAYACCTPMKKVWWWPFWFKACEGSFSLEIARDRVERLKSPVVEYYE